MEIKDTNLNLDYDLISLNKALEMFYNARKVLIDEDYRLFLIWYGGHGISIYDFNGDLRFFYNTGSFADNLTEGEAIKSMNQRIESKDYENYLI